MNAPFFPWAGRIVVIAPECMGYRSLTALLVLAVFFAVYRRLSFKHSILLFAASGALAVLCNLLRIGSILLLALIAPDFAFGAWHDMAGYLFMLLGVFAMAGFGDWLKGGVK